MRSSAAENRIHVGVKYCGGCNPLFDRAQRLREVEQACPDVLFDYFTPEGKYDIILVINGCLKACADLSAMDYEVPKVFAGPDDTAADAADAIGRCIG